MFTTTISPRVSETDAIGHINNTVIPVWFEAARQGVFELLGPVDDFAQWRAIVVNLNIDYRAEIFYPEPVTIRTWVDRVGRTSFGLYEEAWQGDRLCCVGRVTYVNVDPSTKRGAAIEGDVRQSLEAHLRDPEEQEA